MFVVGVSRKVASDDEVVAAAEQETAGLRQTNDDQRLIGGDVALAGHEFFHEGRLRRADMLIGVRDASKEVGEAREVACTIRLETIERVEQAAERIICVRTCVG